MCCDGISGRGQEKLQITDQPFYLDRRRPCSSRLFLTYFSPCLHRGHQENHISQITGPKIGERIFLLLLTCQLRVEPPSKSVHSVCNLGIADRTEARRSICRLRIEREGASVSCFGSLVDYMRQKSLGVSRYVVGRCHDFLGYCCTVLEYFLDPLCVLLISLCIDLALQPISIKF